MPQVIVNIPDAAVERIRDAIAYQLQTTPDKIGINEFRAFMLDYVAKVTLMYERDMHAQNWIPEPIA